MSREDAFAFVERGHTGILTTLRRDGMPISLPLWFACENERVYVATPSKTKKVARLRRDDRVSFLVETGERWAELKAVQLNGRARIVDDPEQIKRVRELLNEKYAAFRTSRRSMPAKTSQHYSSDQTILEILPDERLLSWDNTKLKLGAA